MAISPTILNGILGIGAVSTLGVGGIILYQKGVFNKSEHNYTGVDKLAFESTKGWTFEQEKTSETIGSSATGTNAKIIVKWTDSAKNSGKSWKCTIDGTVNPPATIGSWGIDEQKTELEKALKDSIQKKKTFFDNCIKHRDNTVDLNTAPTSTIHLIIKKESQNKYKFNSKFSDLYTKDINTEKSMVKELGIEGCEINSNTECDLDTSKLKKIKFLGKEDSDLVIDADKKAKLKIESEQDRNIYPEGLKFTLIAKDSDVTIKKSTDNTIITLKQDKRIEFRIKNEENGYFMEKAWNASNLLSMALRECKKSNDGNSCSLQVGKGVNLWKEENNWIIGATIKSDQTGKTITFSEDSNYNQGFKFTTNGNVVLDAANATSKKPSDDTSEDWKLEDENSHYEVEIKTADNKTEWFLIKKTN